MTCSSFTSFTASICAGGCDSTICQPITAAANQCFPLVGGYLAYAKVYCAPGPYFWVMLAGVLLLCVACCVCICRRRRARRNGAAQDVEGPKYRLIQVSAPVVGMGGYSEAFISAPQFGAPQMPVAFSCRNCGAGAHPQARFCGACGGEVVSSVMVQ